MHCIIWCIGFNENVNIHTVYTVHMGVSKNRGTPKWMVYDAKPYSNGWFACTPIFGNIHIYVHSKYEWTCLHVQTCACGSLCIRYDEKHLTPKELRNLPHSHTMQLVMHDQPGHLPHLGGIILDPKLPSCWIFLRFLVWISCSSSHQLKYTTSKNSDCHSRTPASTIWSPGLFHRRLSNQQKHMVTPYSNPTCVVFGTY